MKSGHFLFFLISFDVEDDNNILIMDTTIAELEPLNNFKIYYTK